MVSKQELESRRLAEEAREQRWRGESFLKQLFLGRLRLDLVHPFPEPPRPRPQFRDFYRRMQRFLDEQVDPAGLDVSGEYPPQVVDGLRGLGAFGMKIPTEYGGLGLSHAEYVRVMVLLGSYDANLLALLSAHQAIGVPQPVEMFGSETLKKRYLPRCARGAISGFALTEPAVGSDPARLASTAERSADGGCFILNGEKLWTTNGTLAELLVVLARDPHTGRVDCFVVETAWPGVKVEHRCHFMGLRALANGVVSFRNVIVPRENLIGDEGAGLKIALATLNTGRLTVPAASAGAIKHALEICRKWSGAREQWGVPIGKHEAIAHKLADLASGAYAMESVAHYLGDLADREKVDIRLEAAAAKEWNAVRGWMLADQALQIRGGRGFETERSLAARGEPAIGIERLLRDMRIHLIFEGTSEIMHLFMAREAVDEHLQIAGTLVDPRAGWADKLAALPRVIGFYAWWYPSLWLGWARWPRFRAFGPLAPHLRFVDRMCRHLARQIFHGMLVYRARLERKQAFLFRAVDIAMELFVTSVVIARAHQLQGTEEAESAQRLSLVHARRAERRVRQLLQEMWRNEDEPRYTLAQQVLQGEHRWLESGIMPLGYDEEQLRPPSMERIFAQRGQHVEVSERGIPHTRDGAGGGQLPVTR